MKKYTLLISAALVLVLALLFALSPQTEPKRNALGAVADRLASRPNHSLAVIEGGGRAAVARYNLPVIVRATEYIATLGSNTAVYREVARIAAAADRECPLLEEVLDLAVVRQSESRRVLALAAAACKVRTPEEEVVWRRAFDALWASAEYPSVQAALVAMGAR